MSIWAVSLPRLDSRFTAGMERLSDRRLAAWAVAVPDVIRTTAPITARLAPAVEVLREKFGPVELTLQGSYARSTAVPNSDIDYLLYRCGDPAAAETVWGDSTQRRYENFRNAAEDVLRDWNGASDARRAIWTRVGGVEVHVLPVLPYCSESGDNGAWFWWASGVPPTVTYPELTTARIRERDSAVAGRYCEVVRVLKRIRERTSWESDNLPASSLIESLVFAAGVAPLSHDVSTRERCIGVLQDLRKRLDDDAALTITDPSGHTPLFDGLEHDPTYDEATTFVDEALIALT